MAHEIYANDSIFLHKQPAWHGLGVVLQNAPSTDEAAALAFRRHDGLPGPWTVSRRALYRADGANVETHRAIVRDDTGETLGIVSKRYEPVQNAAVYDVARPLVESGRATWETGGSLYGGATIWGLLKIGNSDVGGGDAVESYLLLDSSHDGSRNVSFRVTSTRVVCANTLAIAGRDRVSLRVRHTASAHDRLDEATDILDRAAEITTAGIAEARAMAARRVTRSETHEFFAALIPDAESERGQKKVDETRAFLLRALDRAPGAQMSTARGTAWGLYQAATFYTSHVRKADDPEARLSDLFYGAGLDMNLRARDMALALAS